MTFVRKRIRDYGVIYTQLTHVKRQKSKTALPVEKMPSLSTSKTESVVSYDATDLAKNMIVMMEKKTRNLEKRKVST